MNELPIKKLYYSIAEVSQITELKQYVLRYWEAEFPDLRPAKNRAGNRVYRLSDIRLIFKIKKLLYSDRYTIAGAREKLKKEKQQEDAMKQGGQLSLSLEEIRKENLLREVRSELQEILTILEGNS